MPREVKPIIRAGMRVRRPVVPPLDRVAEDYLTHCTALARAGRTIQTYRAALALLMRCAPPDALWGTPEGVRAAAAALGGMDYSVSSRSIYVRSWQTFYRWCWREGIIATDLAREIRAPKAEARRAPILTASEVGRLIESAKGGDNPRRDTAILTLLYDCGLRAGEVGGIEVCGVDLGNRSLTIPRGKTGSRSVPIGRVTSRALRDWLAVHADLRPTAPLFPSSRTEEPLSANGVLLLVNRVGQRAGIAVYPHQLRHTFAVTYLRNGGDVFSLQRILGHTTLVMSRWYAELADSDVRARHAVASPGDRLR